MLKKIGTFEDEEKEAVERLQLSGWKEYLEDENEDMIWGKYL